MLRRRSTILAATLLAAFLFLTPGTARAQFFYGGNGLYFGDPSWSSIGSAYMYYPFRAGLGRPTPIGGYGGLTPTGYGAVTGGFGSYTGDLAGLMGGYGGYYGYGGVLTPPLSGLSGYGSFMSPYSYGGWLSPFTYGNNFTSYAGFPNYLSPNYYANNSVSPSLHPSWIYPNYAGYSSLYPSYARVGNYAAPLHGSAAYWPLPAGTPATYTSGLSNLYTPGLNLNSYLSDVTTAGGRPLVSPGATETANLIGPRVRPAVYPAVGVIPGTPLRKEKLPPEAGNAKATVEVVVPTPDAKVWFQGVATTKTGTVREFESPPLSAGASYNYTVRASWRDGTQEVTRTRSVPVRSGERVRVDFTAKK